MKPEIIRESFVWLWLEVQMKKAANRAGEYDMLICALCKEASVRDLTTFVGLSTFKT